MAPWYSHSWCSRVVVITTAQLNSTKPELRFCATSNPAFGVSGIRDGEDLWQWSWLEIRLNAFRRSTIPQKQFIIIIITIIIIINNFKFQVPIMIFNKKGSVDLSSMSNSENQPGNLFEICNENYCLLVS